MKGKIVLITGAARGIGRSCALAFLKKGAKIVLVDKNNMLLQDNILSGGGVLPLCVDIDTPDAVNEIKNVIEKKYGKLDILINNIRCRVDLPESPSDFDKVMRVMVRAPYFLSKECADLMGDEASIINISSIVAFLAFEDNVAYQCAKTATHQMTKILALQLACKGIRVNSISPGFIVQDEHHERYNAASNTSYRDMVNKIVPLRKHGLSDDVINTAVFLASNDATFITGQDIVVDGGQCIQEHFMLFTKHFK